MGKLFLNVGALFVFGIGLIQPELYADDAETLPEGRFRVRLVTAFAGTDSEFQNNGAAESIGSVYSRPLDMRLLNVINPQTKSLSQALNAVQPGLGEDLTIAALNMDVSSQIISNIFALEYGITRDISVGIIVPVVYADIKVKADSEPNERFQTLKAQLPDGAAKQQLTQIERQMTVQGLNALLQSEAFGYSSGLEGWSGYGLGDLEIGGKFNYFRSHPLRATLKPGVRFPTGRVDDPNRLFDMGFGDGQFDIGIYNYVDYEALSYLSFTWEAGYVYQLPDERSFRVPFTTDFPLSNNLLKLDRDLGDYWETGVEANLTLFDDFTLSSKYRFLQKFKDKYSGAPEGVELTVLEAQTSTELHQGIFTAGYDNIRDVRAGRASLPYDVSIFYRHPFAGKNTAQVFSGGVQIKTYF